MRYYTCEDLYYSLALNLSVVTTLLHRMIRFFIALGYLIFLQSTFQIDAFNINQRLPSQLIHRSIDDNTYKSTQVQSFSTLNLVKDDQLLSNDLASVAYKTFKPLDDLTNGTTCL